MKVLVIGGTGTIGKPIVDLLTAQGHEVIAVSRKSSPPVDIGKADALKEFLSEMDPVDHIICTGGGAHIGSTLDELTDDQLYEGINSKMVGQVNIVRFGHKKINKGGSILLTGGIMAYKPIMPNVAHIALINSGLNGFVINSASDLKDTGVRINVLHPPFIQETAKAFGFPADHLPPAAVAAQTYLDCLFKEEGTGQEYFLPGFEKE